MEKALFPDQDDASASTLPPISVGASFQIVSSTNIYCDPCYVKVCELSKTKRLGGSLNEDDKNAIREMIHDFMAVTAGIYEDRKLINIPEGYKVELVSTTTVVTRIVPKDTTQKVLIDGSDAKVIGMAQKMWLSKHNKKGNIPVTEHEKKPDGKDVQHKESCYVCGKKDDTNGVRLNMDGVMGRFFSCAKCKRHWCGECELMQRTNGKVKKCQECDNAETTDPKEKNGKDDYPDSSRIPLAEHAQERVGSLVKNTRTSSSDTETEEHDEPRQEREQSSNNNEISVPTMVGDVLPVKNMSEYNMGHMMMGFMAVLGERIQSNMPQCPIPYYPLQPPPPQPQTSSTSVSSSKKRKAEQETPRHTVKKEPKKKATTPALKQQRPVYTRPASSTPLQYSHVKREPSDRPPATKERKRQHTHKNTNNGMGKGKSGTWSRVFRCTKDTSHAGSGDSAQDPTCLRVRWKKDIVGALAHASKAHGLPHLDWDTTGTEWICKTDGCGYVVSTIPPPITHEELQGHINGMITKNIHASPADWEYDVLNHMRSAHNVHCIISKEEDTSMAHLIPGTSMHFKTEMDSHYNGHQQLLIPKMEPIADERVPGAIKLAPITQVDKDAEFDAFDMQFHDSLAFLDIIPKETDTKAHELSHLAGYMQGMDEGSRSGHSLGLDL